MKDKDEHIVARSVRLKTAAQTENRRLRAENKALILKLRAAEIVKRIGWTSNERRSQRRSRKPQGGSPTHEILFGDLHYGKLAGGYSCSIAEDRVKEYAHRIVGLQAKEKPSRTTLVFLGDLLENSTKHIDARDGCEIGTQEQAKRLGPILYNFVRHIRPGAGKILDVVCISGNHENPNGRGSAYNYQGRMHLSYPIYAGLEMATSIHDGKPSVFHITDGVFASYRPYGDEDDSPLAVAEHGSGVQVSENALGSRRGKRAQQLDRHVSYYRQGDKHTLSLFEQGSLSVNGAFFSPHHTEFSGAVGYCGHPAQLVFTHSARGIEDIHMLRLD